MKAKIPIYTSALKVASSILTYLSRETYTLMNTHTHTDTNTYIYTHTHTHTNTYIYIYCIEKHELKF